MVRPITSVVFFALLIGLIALSVYLVFQRTGLQNRASSRTEAAPTSRFGNAIKFSTTLDKPQYLEAEHNKKLNLPDRATIEFRLKFAWPEDSDVWHRYILLQKGGNYSCGNAYSIYLQTKYHKAVGNYDEDRYYYKILASVARADSDGKCLFYEQSSYENNIGPSEKDKWRHLALTFQSAPRTVSLFDNGKKHSLSISNQSSAPAFHNTRPLHITNLWALGNATPDYEPFTGTLDELRISKVIRYSSDFQPPSKPLAVDPNTLALWHFDELSCDKNYLCFVPDVANSKTEARGFKLVGSPLLVDSRTGDPVNPPPSYLPPTGPNLISNPSFELDTNSDGRPDNWLARNLDSGDVIVDKRWKTGQQSFQFSPLPANSTKREVLIQNLSRSGQVGDLLSFQIYNASENDILGLHEATGLILRTLSSSGTVIDQTGIALSPRSHGNFASDYLSLKATKPYDRIRLVIFNTNYDTNYYFDDAYLTVVENGSGNTTSPTLSSELLNNTDGE